MLRGTDPSELERERQLKEKLAQNPRAVFGDQAQQQTTSTNTAGDSNKTSSFSGYGSNEDIAKAWQAFSQANSKKGFWEQFAEFRKLRDEQRGRTGGFGGFGGGSSPGSSEPGWGRVVASLIVLYATFKILFQAQGAGDIGSTLIPFWVTSYETQAKYLLLGFVLTKTEKEHYQNMFAQARRTRPLLTFFDFLDESYPQWANGNKNTGAQVVTLLTGTIATQSQWQIVSLTNRIQYALRSGTGTTADKVDILMETVQSHLGGKAALVARMKGMQGTGEPLQLSLQGGADGQPPRITDGSGYSMPFYTGAPPSGTAYISSKSYPISEAPAGMIPPGLERMVSPGGAPAGSPPPTPASMASLAGLPPGTQPSVVMPMIYRGGTPPPPTAGANPAAGAGDTMSTEGHGTVPTFK